jgi:DNA polymerase V
MFPATLVRDIYKPDFSSLLEFDLYECPVSAGFPSPADDYVEGRLDLNRYLVKHPAATFFVRVTGDSMIDAGIHPGDLLIVDRAIAPTNGKVVIAVLNGELTVKRVRQSKQKLLLVPDNPKYPSLQIHAEMDFQIWGVVTNVIHAL